MVRSTTGIVSQCQSALEPADTPIPWETVSPRPDIAVYFAHGDICRVVADDTPAYYCALHDSFVRAEHFACAHPWWEHLWRYALSLRRATEKVRRRNTERACSPGSNWVVRNLLGGAEPARSEWPSLLRLWRVRLAKRPSPSRWYRAPAPAGKAFE